MIWLAICGIVEAVVLRARYRASTLSGPFVTAWWAFWTCALRVIWLTLGVSELMHGGDCILVVASYALPAAIATGVVRWWESRPHAPRRHAWANDNPNPAPPGPPPIVKTNPGATRIGPAKTERGA